MSDRDFERVCYWTEQREERVPVRNKDTGYVGYSFGCTQEGATVQVELASGELDSWGKETCIAVDD